MKPIVIFIFLVALGFQDNLFATTVTAVPPGGDWSNAGTWDGPIPGCYDTIIIPVGSVVNVDVMVDLTACPATYILVQGELHFNTGKKMQLPCGSAVFMDPGPPPGTLTKGGGGGSSNLIDICGITVWQASDGDLSGPTVLCLFCALPIELIEFTAELENHGVSIKWKTASELNNDFFTIERSEDGKVWEVLSQLDGAGNSSVAISYQEYDRTPLFGISYYRLEQTDFDSKSKTYDPVAVNVSIAFDEVELILFPNPNDGNQVSIYLPGDEGDLVEIIVYSLSGKVVYKEQIEVSGGGLVVVRLEGMLPAGSYIFNAAGRIARMIIE
ncbi:T9SS type A sorting domain-containing protein [Crocinitomix catalasitica]|nr:T9SS type A sorting domain-containing protein [Crocinitomix catalasitica]